MRYLVILFVLMAMLSGCSRKPAVPEAFKGQLMKFLDAGTKINVMLHGQLSYTEFRQQLADTKAAHDLMGSMWPGALSQSFDDGFAKAIEGWDLVLSLWTFKVDGEYPPSEVGNNGYDFYVAYEGDKVWTEEFKSDCPDISKRGKLFIPVNENVRIIGDIAGEAFEDGRNKILKELEK
ncbi:MAG: hypothetical protein HY811_02535 [Planctomycetes bacterium]|nr:hypothetical protein [Planctomycetota bacterium]